MSNNIWENKRIARNAKGATFSKIESDTTTTTTTTLPQKEATHKYALGKVRVMPSESGTIRTHFIYIPPKIM